MDDDDLHTLLCEVELIINDWPITKTSDDPNNHKALTPNHLLLMRKQPALPPGVFKKDDVYASYRWKQIQYLVDPFWHGIGGCGNTYLSCRNISNHPG